MNQRTIKFRAWDIHNKRMITDALELQKSVITKRAALDFAFDVVWMQFTGLTDKNGVEIFEGDVVNFGHKNNVEVVFENGSFSVFNEPLGWDFDTETYPIQTDMKYCEVVGNRFQNPDLLNQ